MLSYEYSEQDIGAHIVSLILRDILLRRWTLRRDHHLQDIIEN